MKYKKVPQDPDNMNNLRAMTAKKALEVQVDEMGSNPHTDEALRDLLCNLRHLCDRRPWSFPAALRASKAMYREECGR